MDRTSSMGRTGGIGRMAGMVRAIVTIIAMTAVVAAETPGITIDLATGTERERRTKITLEHLLTKYDLKKYTFTNRVVIEERATNHAFPVLTLNVRFANMPDDLLAAYIHEQLLWRMRDLDERHRSAVV